MTCASAAADSAATVDSRCRLSIVELFDKHGLDISRRFLYELARKPATCVYCISGNEHRKIDASDKKEVGDDAFIKDLIEWSSSMYIDMTSTDSYQQDLKSHISTQRILVVAFIDSAITLQDSQIKCNLLCSVAPVGSMVELPDNILFGAGSTCVRVY